MFVLQTTLQGAELPEDVGSFRSIENILLLLSDNDDVDVINDAMIDKFKAEMQARDSGGASIGMSGGEILTDLRR